MGTGTRSKAQGWAPARRPAAHRGGTQARFLDINRYSLDKGAKRLSPRKTARAQDGLPRPGCGTRENPLLTFLHAWQRYGDPALLRSILVNERQVAELRHFPSVQKFLKGETQTSHCGRWEGCTHLPHLPLYHQHGAQSCLEPKRDPGSPRQDSPGPTVRPEEGGFL